MSSIILATVQKKIEIETNRQTGKEA
ncbi:hypothetical protein, partial [Plasmodium yoelii yoelii]